MCVNRKWTALRIRELAAKDGTLLQFTLNGGEPENTENISLHTLDRKMAKFRDHQLTAAELSEYITSLVPPLIRQRLQALDRRRLFLGIITERDLNAEHPFPFHAIPWEAAYVYGKEDETWAMAYSAVRIVGGAKLARPRKPERIGLFCCEYNPPLARRDAMRAVLEDASKRKLSEVREITGRTAAGDFLALQSGAMFCASCHGEETGNGPGRSTIGLVKPGYAQGEDRYFLTVEPGEGKLSCAELFADPPPAVFCLDACFSAYDQRVPEHLIGRGCNVFIGNVFEAVQDSRKNGTPAVREIQSQILTGTCGRRQGIGSCVSCGRRGAKDADIYHTLVYVNSMLAPGKDAFGFEGAIELPRWFLLVLLAAVSLFVSIVIGRALVFRYLLTQTSSFIRLLLNVGIGGVLFLIGFPTVPKDVRKKKIAR